MALDDPQFTFSYFVHEETKHSDNPREQDYTIMQMFPWFGKLEARTDAAAAFSHSRMVFIFEKHLKISASHSGVEQNRFFDHFVILIILSLISFDSRRIPYYYYPQQGVIRTGFPVQLKNLKKPFDIG